MKLYHLLPDEKFIDDFIARVLGSSRKPAQNVFLVRASRPFQRVTRMAKHVQETPLYSKALRKIVDSVTSEDRFIVHYLKRDVCEWLRTIDHPLPLGWVFWGAEFYNNAGINYPLYGPLTQKIYRPNLLNIPWLYHIPFFRKVEIFYERHIKGPRMYQLKSFVFNQVRYFYHYNEYDFELIKQYFDFPANREHFIYPRIFDVPDFDSETKPPFDINREQVNVMIGNSANYTNNHLEVFARIDPSESLVLWVPLSYGDTIYKDYLIKAGKKKFGEQFRPLTDYLPSDQYFSFLKHMDAGLFGNLRPLAMGNITTLLTLGKRVFLFDQTTSTKYLKDRGFHINSLDQLNTQELLKLKRTEPLAGNIALAERYFFGNQISEIYKKLF